MVNLKSGGQWTSSTSVYVGTQAGATGTVNINAGSWDTAGNVRVGSSGSGVVNLYPGGQWTGSGSVWLGQYANATGTVNLSGGNWSPAGVVHVGESGAGVVNVSAGSQWSSPQPTFLGQGGGGRGVVNLNNGGRWTGSSVVGEYGYGEVNVRQGGQWTGSATLGHWPGAKGVVNITGGTWTANGPVQIGGEPNIGGSGAINLTGGTMAVAGQNLIFGSQGTLTLDGGRLDLSGDATLPGDRRFDFRSGTLQVDGRLNWPGMHTISPGSNVILSGNSARWEPSSLTVSDGASLMIDGATLHLTPGSLANFSSPIAFGSQGGRVELDHALLIHAAKPLAVLGNQVTGSGEIVVGSAGIHLGSTDHPGMLTGTSEADRLLVYGDIGGSGTITNTTIFGNMSVGSSPGEMTLENVLFGPGSTLAMEIAGADPAQFDRLILGPGGVDFGSCPIDIDFAVGFVPDPASAFDLFDTAGGGDLLAALGPATIHTPTDWVLDRSTGVVGFVPEPATLALLALGGLVALLRRRR